MKFHLRNKSLITLALAVLLIAALPACKGNTTDSTSAQQSSAATPQQVDSSFMKGSLPVMDYAKVISETEIQEIGNIVNRLNDANIAQVAVVTTTDLEGKSVKDFAVGFGNKWGVGHKETNDGITIVVKPKTADSKGEAAIATGIGMEKLLTDEVCSQIINQKMIPWFKENNYGKGIEDALIEIEKLLKQ